MLILIKISQLAALADCIEGVNIDRVNYYRQEIRDGKKINPIVVRGINPQEFYVIHDGHHRTIAHAMEELDEILAEIDQNIRIINISWRWPRISPVSHTIDLMSLVGLIAK